MASEKMSKLVISYSLPTIIGMLVNALYNVISRFWVGKIPDVGSVAITGVGLSMPFTIVLLGCAQLVGIGAATAISISLGKRQKDVAEKILGNALVYIIIGALLLTSVSLIFLEDLLRLVGASDATLPYAIDFTRIIMGGCIFQQVSFAMNHPIRATGNAKRFASTQMVGAALNMVLDPLFIFTFGLGITGAAIATVLSQFVSFAWVMSYYFTKDSLLKIRLVNLIPKYDIAKLIYSLGFSSFLMQVTASLVSIVANHSLLHYGLTNYGNGDIAIGAMTIINSLTALIFMPIIGIYQGITPIIGFNYGARNIIRAKQAYKWGLVYGVAIAVAGLIIVEIFAPNLIVIFNDDADLVAIGSVGLRILFCAFPLATFQMISNALFLAMGRAKISIFLNMLRQVIFLVPFYLILPLVFGFNGIWMAIPLSDTLAAGVTFLLISKELKRLGELDGKQRQQ